MSNIPNDKKMTIGTRNIGGTSSIVTKVKYVFQQLWLKLFMVLSDIVKYRRYDNQSQQQQQQQHKGHHKRSSHQKGAQHKIPEVKGLPLVGTLFELIAAGGAPK